MSKKNNDGLPSEYMRQVKLVCWWRRNYPAIEIYHTPNGEKREKAVALRLKNMGVKRGIWDLYAREVNLWIEVKKPGESLTKEQKEWQEYCEPFGDNFIVVDDLNEGIKEITTFLNNYLDR